MGQPNKSVFSFKGIESLQNLLRKNNTLLENLVKNQVPEYNRNSYPIVIVIDVPNGITALTQYGSKKSLPYTYYIDAIGIRNETNGLAGAKLRINGIDFPEACFFVD